MPNLGTEVLIIFKTYSRTPHLQRLPHKIDTGSKQYELNFSVPRAVQVHRSAAVIRRSSKIKLKHSEVLFAIFLYPIILIF
jgi:hypothetical protein